MKRQTPVFAFTVLVTIAATGLCAETGGSFRPRGLDNRRSP